jgi:hypothetical protein
MTQAENTVLLLGFVAFVTMFLLRGQSGLGMGYDLDPSASADEPDVWQTPFYLRVNMPVAQGEVAVMPNNRWASWSLGVPQPSAQRGTGYGR